MISVEFGIMMLYRLLALIVAGSMIAVVWREKSWHTQFFAILVFIPFVLRAFGTK